MKELKIRVALFAGSMQRLPFSLLLTVVGFAQVFRTCAFTTNSVYIPTLQPVILKRSKADRWDGEISVPAGETFSKSHVVRKKRNLSNTQVCMMGGLFDFLTKDVNTSTKKGDERSSAFDASSIVSELVKERKCYTTIEGVKAFMEASADNIIYEDCNRSKEPFIGKEAVEQLMTTKVSERKGKGDVRLDRVTDGTTACGFAWTYTSGDEEGLRGTTFVDFDASSGKIAYIREISEPLYKPGDLTAKLLEAVTKGATRKAPVEYTKRTPQKASDIAKYLFNEVQGSDIDESMRLFDKDIVYRDFNYDNVFVGKDAVRDFIKEFDFPGITFRTERFDNGVTSTAFTWDVVLDGIEDTTKGISFYEINPQTKLISYVRDVPESAIKPAPLGALAKFLRPGLAVFDPVPIGSREGGK